MQEHEGNPLVKAVPTHLFQFEEKIFGMSLQQLLTDIGAGVGLFTLTAELSVVTRIVVCVLLAVPVLILVHGQVDGQPLLQWLYLYARFLFLPKETSWQSTEARALNRSSKVPAVQTTWIHLDHLSGGMMGYSEPGGTSRNRGRYWVVLEVEGRNIRYLPDAEQVRIYGHFERFLTGCEFRLQFISLIEQVQPAAYPALSAQREAVLALQRSTPRLARLQQASVAFQQRHLQSCTITRHFVVISVSAREEVLRRRTDGARRGLIRTLLHLLVPKAEGVITREEVLDQLRIRTSVVKKLCQQLEVRAWLLDDPDLLRLFASCLAPGAEVPTFRAVDLDEAAQAACSLARPGGAKGSGRFGPGHRWKSLRGLHGTIVYESTGEAGCFEAAVRHLADLVAPSRIKIHPDMLEVTVRGKTRYQRYLSVTGYGHQVLCGWLADLSELGLPMVISSSFEPLDTAFMIARLELHLVKLESQRLSDQKTLKITKANQSVEAEQVRRVLHELAARRRKVFATNLTIGIHAGSRERLEQRSHYLLSHLRQKQLRVRACRRRHDIGLQLSLPVCPPLDLSQTVNLPSDALSTFLHASSGVVGTPTGVFLGFIGSGFSRRPVYFNPWSEERKIPNPHVVVVGETGMGKSWLGKTLVTGLMGMGIADVVVLDRDDDYLPLHEFLGEECQRYNLARGCPINFFDLPFAPSDVDPADPLDRLAEFLDNHLLVGLALLICDTETTLSKLEEAYLMAVARATYAAKGLTSEAIRRDPTTLLLPAPTLADFLQTMKQMPASSKTMRQSLIERLEKASYLFRSETSIRLHTPLTIFSIHDLDEKWYPLMTFVVQNFLYRHRALRGDERYLAYIVEEASYMLRHPAGRRYLESGSRGFRKLGIAQFTLSQHPRDFLEEGQVILANAGTAFFLGMQRNAAEKLHLSPELERTLTEAVPGQAVMRCGNEYAAIQIAAIPLHRTLFTTDPQERKKIRVPARREEQASAGTNRSPRKDEVHAKPS
jgi:uncharacterized protein (UPF0248 family)